jgi:UDP-N-acetylglucosamine:LPS N-acetylglucosamine transferase
MTEILFASSGGGHFDQARDLAKKVALSHDCWGVFERQLGDRSSSFPGLVYESAIVAEGRVAIVGTTLKMFLDKEFLFKFAKTNTVISTGGFHGLIILIIALFFFKRCIYIESIARQTSLSRVGRIVRFLPLTRYCQSRRIAEQYDNFTYAGVIYQI